MTEAKNEIEVGEGINNNLSRPGIMVDGEQIYYEDFKKEPLQLIKFAKKLCNKKEFEDALEVLNNAIQIVLEKVDGDKMNLECTPFYLSYADILIRKVGESEELLANLPRNNDDESDAGDGHGENEDEDDEDEKTEEATDEEIAYDNIFSCQKIYQDFLKKYESIPSNEMPEEAKQINFQLSEVYMMYANLEICKSEFQKAISYLEQALDTRIKYEDQMSRAISEVYYEMAICYDFDVNQAFTNYYKTKIIMEYHLQKNIDASSSTFKPKIFFDEEIPKLSQKTISHLDIKMNLNNVVQSFGDTEEITELKMILEQIYLKV